MEEVLESKSEKIIESTEDYCGDCKFCEHGENHKSLLVPIKSKTEVLGVIITCFDIEREIDEEEINLLREAASDLAFAREKIQAEKELRESKDQYKDLFNGTDAPVLVHDFEGDFLSVNDAAVEKIGYSREEFLKMNVRDIGTPQEEELVPYRIEELKEEESINFESVHLTKVGEEIPVEIHSTVIDYGGEKAVIGIARDISERKEFRIRRLLYSLLSHDLQTKLKTAEGLLELLEEKDVPPEY